MAELLTLTVPVVQTRTTYRLSASNFDWDAAYIYIRLVGSDGGEIVRTYSGAVASAKMNALNNGNFSLISLQKKTLQMLQVDFPELAGVITGTPL